MKNILRFILNETVIETTLPEGTVTLDFIRKQARLTGTKEGCKEGECGACTVLLGKLTGESVSYKAVASCLLPIGELHGKHVVTVEGVNQLSLNPLQDAIVKEGASQCGFCTPGIILSLTGFFLTSPNLDYQDAIDALDGNICRCTGYASIRRAASNLCETFKPKYNTGLDRINQLVKWSILPNYFLQIPNRLITLNSESPLPYPDILSNENGNNSTIVGGATDLFVQRPDELAEKELTFISNYNKLSRIVKKDNWIFVGAGTTISELKDSPLINEYFPGMDDYLSLVSSTIMRNRATVAGNLVNASPIGDLSIIFLALGANISISKGNTTREFPLYDFFKDYKKIDLEKGEIIDTIEIPAPLPSLDFRFHFEKVSQRKYLDIASCNTAISFTLIDDIIDTIHASAGGVAPIPLYLKHTCAFLQKKKLNINNISSSLKIMENEISPISDVRGSNTYKTKLLRNLFISHFIALFPKENFDELLKDLLS